MENVVFVGVYEFIYVFACFSCRQDLKKWCNNLSEFQISQTKRPKPAANSGTDLSLPSLQVRQWQLSQLTNFWMQYSRKEIYIFTHFESSTRNRQLSTEYISIWSYLCAFLKELLFLCKLNVNFNVSTRSHHHFTVLLIFTCFSLRQNSFESTCLNCSFIHSTTLRKMFDYYMRLKVPPD